MTINYIMGIIASVALLCPVILILVLRLAKHKTFIALLIYYSLFFIYNLMVEKYIAVSRLLEYYWGISINILEVPLMLIFLLYLSPSASFAQKMKYVIGGFLIFQIIVIAKLGYNIKSMTVVLGPGFIVVLGFCFYFFNRYTKIAILQFKAVGKAMIAAALLFSYGSSLIIYLMYYIFQLKYVSDVFLLYFMGVIISSTVLSGGIILEARRVREILELKTIRRELSEFYTNENKTSPIRSATMPDFDKEPWG